MRRRQIAIHRVVILGSTLLVLAGTSCDTKEDPIDDTPAGTCTTVTGAAVTYTSDIQPILATSCTDCHAPDGQQSSVPLDTCATLAQQANTVLDQINAEAMPPLGASQPHVSDINRDKIAAWIDAGMPL